MLAYVGGRNLVLAIPPAEDSVLPGVAWGRFDELFTPAYWRGQAWQHTELGTYRPGPLGRDLAEEVSACILGGYGIPAEIGLAAFNRLKNFGLLISDADEAKIASALAQPFEMEGKYVKYRFPRQKARVLAGALREMDHVDPLLPDVALRDALLVLPGVGLKTASWIVRNVRQSDQIAILDVHIARAGRIAGFFRADWTPDADYIPMEAIFLRFASAIGVGPAFLDGLMWDYMRRLGQLARRLDGWPPSDRDEGASMLSAFATPMAATPQGTMRLSPGNMADDTSRPSTPRGQNRSSVRALI